MKQNHCNSYILSLFVSWFLFSSMAYHSASFIYDSISFIIIFSSLFFSNFPTSNRRIHFFSSKNNLVQCIVIIELCIMIVVTSLDFQPKAADSLVDVDTDEQRTNTEIRPEFISPFAKVIPLNGSKNRNKNREGRTIPFRPLFVYRQNEAEKKRKQSIRDRNSAIKKPLPAASFGPSFHYPVEAPVPVPVPVPAPAPYNPYNPYDPYHQYPYNYNPYAYQSLPSPPPPSPSPTSSYGSYYWPSSTYYGEWPSNDYSQSYYSTREYDTSNAWPSSSFYSFQPSVPIAYTFSSQWQK